MTTIATETAETFAVPKGAPVPIAEAFGKDTAPLSSFFRTSEKSNEIFRIVAVEVIQASEYSGKYDPPTNRKAWNVLTCQRPDGSTFRIDCVKSTIDRIFRDAFSELGLTKDSIDPLPEKEHGEIDWALEVLFPSSANPPRAAALKLTARTPSGRSGVWQI